MVTIFVLYCACTKETSWLLDKVIQNKVIQNKLKASIIDFETLSYS